MISRKTKLLGVSTFLLGVPSSASLSSVDLSRFSLDNIFSSPGGAKAARLGDLVYGMNQVMKVGESVKNLKAVQQKEISSPKLAEVKETIDLSKEEKVNDSNSGDTVKTTYSEITRENKALVLNLESKSKVEAAQQQSKKWIADYQSAKKKLDSYIACQQQQSSRRSKRHTHPTTNTALTKKERQALEEMYKIFELLHNDKGEMVPKIQEISGSETISLPGSSIPTSQSFKNNLQAIGWTTLDNVRYTTVTPAAFGKQRKPDEWKDWNRNPYKKFLDSEVKFQDLVKVFKEADAKLQSYLARNRVNGLVALFRSPNAVRSTYSEKHKFDSMVSDAKSAFANEVAKKLLMWMGQIRAQN